MANVGSLVGPQTRTGHHACPANHSVCPRDVNRHLNVLLCMLIVNSTLLQVSRWLINCVLILYWICLEEFVSK